MPCVLYFESERHFSVYQVGSRPPGWLPTCNRFLAPWFDALLLMPLIALLLFLFLPWPYALALYIPIAGVSLLGYWKMLQAQRQPPAVGTPAMIGRRAEVISSKGEEIIEVRYRGEAWRAISSHTLQRGQRVVIEAVDGLTLRVAPLSQPAEDPVQ